MFNLNVHIPWKLDNTIREHSLDKTIARGVASRYDVVASFLVLLQLFNYPGIYPRNLERASKIFKHHCFPAFP
jgi:hypothetical protein